MNHFTHRSYVERCQFVYYINNRRLHARIFPKRFRDFPHRSRYFHRVFLRFFSVICACPHRTNVFIFSAVFDPLGTRFYLASDKRESFRRHLFKIILPKLDYLWGFASSSFSQSNESCETFHHRVPRCTRIGKKKGENFHLARSFEARRRGKRQLRLLVDNANIEPKSNGKIFLLPAKESRVIFPPPESFSLNFHSQIHFNSVNYRNLNISVRSGKNSNLN